MAQMVSQIRLSPNPFIHRVFLRRDPPAGAQEAARGRSVETQETGASRIWKREAKMDILGFECSYS